MLHCFSLAENEAAVREMGEKRKGKLSRGKNEFSSLDPDECREKLEKRTENLRAHTGNYF